MPHTIDELGRAALGRLSDAVCVGDAFMTWCDPGRMVRPQDFEFCAHGLGSEPDAQAQRRLIRQAGAVAELVDVMPTAHTRLSTEYGRILRRCRVVRGELSAEERLKVEKFRNLIRTTRKVTDPATGEEREVTDVGPMLKAYVEKQSAYLTAVTRYNLQRAAGPDRAADVEHHRRQVRSAMDTWISCGYRNEVDQVTAYLDQVGRRDLVLWRRDLVEMYDDALIDADGDRFHYTTLVPGDFATADCWTDVSIDAAGINAAGIDGKRRPASWRAGIGDVGFGLRHTVVCDFSLRFKLSQAIISRPWFYPEFLGNRGWTLDGAQVCDGGDPPSGSLVGYPTVALFVRDLRIDSAELARAYRTNARLSSVGWGPFRLTGALVDATGLTVPGMQLVGFVNQPLGKAPDPLPQLDTEQFV